METAVTILAAVNIGIAVVLIIQTAKLKQVSERLAAEAQTNRDRTEDVHALTNRLYDLAASLVNLTRDQQTTNYRQLDLAEQLHQAGYTDTRLPAPTPTE